MDNKISAKIIADSISPQGHRITTFELVFPRMILAEAKTHRVLSGLHKEIEILEDISLNSFKEGSKNSASSRAIPFSKMVKAVQDNPFIPIAWQKEHKGMQGSEYITEQMIQEWSVEKWLEARDNAVKLATELNQRGVTKQLCNRLLEPFMWHKVLLTATEFDNFFQLRCPQYHTPVSGEGFYFKSKKECIKNHSNPENIKKLEAMSDLEWLQIDQGQSEIHMMALAECMWDAYNESAPKQLKAGEWHIPYIESIKIEATNMLDTYLPSFKDYIKKDLEKFIKVSTAKCARVSYTTVGEDDKEIPYEKDIALHDSLIASGHMSPTEHIARCMSEEEYYHAVKALRLDVTKYLTPKWQDEDFGWCNNFRGWIQYRYLLENQ